MQRIERTKQFKQDYRRELKGRHRATLETDLVEVLQVLINNQPLAVKHRDHALIGDWKDYRVNSGVKMYH
ncbi:MAG: type II toxin-antitoxin system mRNA interferase toxin, RelE/StbE family [Nitrosomonas ureae]